MSANDSVANLLARIRADNEADDDLARLQGQLEMFDDTDADATAEVHAKGEGDLAKLAAMYAAFAKEQDVTHEVKIDTDKADRNLRRFWGRNQTALFDWASGLRAINKEIDDVGREKRVTDVVDVHEDQLQIKELADQLRLFDEDHVDATADVNTAIGQTKLQKLKAALREFGRMRVSAEANVDPDGRAANSAQHLWHRFRELATGVDQADRGGNRLRASFGVITGLTVQTAVAVYALVAALGTALVAALAAVVASAAAAATALVAIGIAAGGAATAIGAFVAFAAFRFKDLLAKGGTVAEELQRAWKQTGAVLARELSPTARPVFRALTAELRNIRPALETLRPAFMALGGAAAASIKIVADEVRQLMPQFRALLFSAAPIMPLLAEGFGQFLGILLNIANAAMPFLISGLQKVVEWLKRFNQFTTTDEFKRDLAIVVDHLRSWLELGHQISRVFFEFFKVIAPLGKDIVDDLAEGAKHLADWIANNPDEVRQTMQELISVARDVWDLFVRLVEAVIAFSVAVAPALAVVIPIITILLGLFLELLNFINGLPGPIRLAASMFLLFLGPIGFIRLMVAWIGRLILILGAPLLAAIARAAGSIALLGGTMIATGVRMAAGLITGLLTGLAGLGGRLAAGLGSAIRLAGATAAGTSAVLAGAAIITGLINGMFIAGSKNIPDFIGRFLQVTLGGPLYLFANLLGVNIFGAIGHGIKEGARVWAGAIKDAVSNPVKRAVTATWTEANQTTAKGVGDIANQIESGAKRFAGGIQRGMSGAAKQAEAGAKSIASGILKGMASAARQVQTGAQRIADAAARGVAAGETRARTAGLNLGNAVASGIGGAGVAVAGAASRLSSAALAPIKAAEGQGHSSGVALGTGFANGIASTAGAVAAGAAKIAAAARAQLPGSEPKDPTSPLRGLGKAGEAIPVMMARGIKQTGPALVNALDGVLTELELRLDRLRESSTKKARRIAQALEAMIPRIERLKEFQEAVINLGDTMQDVANKARDAWADAREMMELAALAGSPEGQELSRLLGEQQQFDRDFELRGMQETIGDAQQRLAELQTELVDPLRDRSIHDIEADIVAQERIIRDTNDRINALNRQSRITDLQNAINSKKEEITARAQLARDGFDAEANAYRDSLINQFVALQGMLAAGEISYATFARRVKKILGPLADVFDIDASDATMLAGGKGFIESFIEGMNSMRGRAKAILRSILAELRDMLPGSEPKDKSSPLRRLPGTGEAVMEQLAAGISRGSNLVLKSLYSELAPIAQIAPTLAVRANPVGGGGGGVTHVEVNRNYNLPPGPGGGYEPMFAASQLDKLMQDEGGWGKP